MRKVDRLFEIVQFLRGKRLRTAAFIAQELGVSVRTIYRDIQGLMASGVPIEGEPGIGYIIRQSIELPPLKFTPLELKALQLGIKMVVATADEEIAHAAKEASVKILDALPNRSSGDDAPIAYVYFESDFKTRESLALLRDALNKKVKVGLCYANENKKISERIVRPMGLEYWGKVWTLTSWCELRNDFRVFRIDRIKECKLTDKKFRNEKGKTYQDYLKGIEHKCD
jgi:predicted DNA-binding transcriptional regulator YafY